MSLVTRHVSQFGLRHSGSNFYVHWHAQPHTLFVSVLSRGDLQ